MKNNFKIKPLTAEGINDFFNYLNDHISDNGLNGAPLFLPIAKDDLNLPESLKGSFKDGMSIPLDQLGWRRVLVALNEQEEIVGHIDLKSHNQKHTQHRAIMGMGVDREYRQMGLGSLLITSISEWAKNKTTVEHIDLWVLAENSKAIRLYEKLGFKRIGIVEDMFRIDNASLHYIMMAKKI